MIVGVTHAKNGAVRVNRPVTVKVAIGLPPTEGSNRPQRLDHFIFLRKIVRDKTIAWDIDDKLTEHYGKQCREIWITLLDDDPDVVLRTEYAAWKKRGRWCHGDGETAERREISEDGKAWGEMRPHDGPCANHGCPVFESGDCGPSGDLYFMLSDFPTLGTICRLHTSSYQSIKQIYSALHDLRAVTGGRLMGVPARLFVHADRNLFQNRQGASVSGLKWVLGLELNAEHLRNLAAKLLEAPKVFRQIRGELGGQILQIEEDEAERGAEISGEFRCERSLEDVEKQLREEADRLMEEYGLKPDKRAARLESYKGRLDELVEKVKAQLNARTPRTPQPPAPQKSDENLGITDEDFPKQQAPQEKGNQGFLF